MGMAVIMVMMTVCMGTEYYQPEYIQYQTTCRRKFTSDEYYCI